MLYVLKDYDVIELCYRQLNWQNFGKICVTIYHRLQWIQNTIINSNLIMIQKNSNEFMKHYDSYNEFFHIRKITWIFEGYIFHLDLNSQLNSWIKRPQDLLPLEMSKWIKLFRPFADFYISNWYWGERYEGYNNILECKLFKMKDERCYWKM